MTAYIKETLDYIQNSVMPVVILCGDINQISHDVRLDMSLNAILYAPIHCGHNLNRIYMNCLLCNDFYVKIVGSTVATEQRAIVA